MQEYRDKLKARPDNPEVLALGPVTTDERVFVRYLNNAFVHLGILIAKEAPLTFSEEKVEQMYEYSSKKNAARVEPITFDAAINPKRRDPRKLWTNHNAETDAEGKLLPYSRFDLVNTLKDRETSAMSYSLLLWHSPKTLIVMKELKSKPNCGRQYDHGY